ncbi:response regulator [Crassaminicella profunda]|uniref:response regulator n=1 Tax=Crassaminicella profunda TaxID=1286698 RepID=UPI001CA647CE|nr:response regulator [Crassaminicella profunda]QZY54035.1 response regulator [Crassaminicella profunda]
MNILIVDDTKFNLEYAKNILIENKINCHILLANSGKKALNLLAAQTIDIVILDIVMPEIDGLEVLKEIRKDEKHHNIPVIMFTSLTDKQALKKSFEYGATDFINKPIEPIEFISRVKSAISIRNYALYLNETLDTIKEQNQELLSLNKKLQETQFYLVQKEKLVAIGQLAAGVAHEINNPIGYVSSNTETLSKYIHKIKTAIDQYRKLLDCLSDTDIQSKEVQNHMKELYSLKKKLHLDFIMTDIDSLIDDSFKGLEKITKIVQSLRNFARHDLENDFNYYDFNDLVEETLLLIKNEAKYIIDIEKDLKDLPLTSCNRTQIGQVLLNIMVNAVQAIKSQSREEQGLITISTFSNENYVVCEIIDDGPGIPKDIIDKIFNPFFTTKEVGSGTGLGLSISYDIIVNKHSGELLVSSEVDQGTTFTIKLPIKKMSS